MVIAFPVRQHSINSASWIRWTKNLNSSGTVYLYIDSKLDIQKGAEDENFDELLQTALKKQELEFDLNVLCNDSTACLYTGLGELI